MISIRTDDLAFAFFPTSTSSHVSPRYSSSRRINGSSSAGDLMDAALSLASGGKSFLGAQPQSVEFFERLGYERGPVGFVAPRRTP